MNHWDDYQLNEETKAIVEQLNRYEERREKVSHVVFVTLIVLGFPIILLGALYLTCWEALGSLLEGGE